MKMWLVVAGIVGAACGLAWVCRFRPERDLPRRFYENEGR